jgi:hypothetical protein
MNTQSESVAWEPKRVFLDSNLVEDVGFDLMDNYQVFDFQSMSVSERCLLAIESGEIANRIILKLMKGAK